MHESEEHNGSDPVYYIREPDGELIARVDNGSIAYYHFDALGSTTLLTDAMGTVTDTYAYDAWGNLMAHTGTTAQPYQFVGQLGYYAHWQDANLALLQLGVRFYDPEAGRFGQRDPMAPWVRPGVGVENAYRYAGDMPTSKADPMGLYEEFWCTTGPRRCPDLPKYVKELLDALQKEDCLKAVAEVGCKDFINKMKDPKKHPLEGMRIYCVKPETGYAGACEGSHDIRLNCSSRNPAATLLHELIHACAYNAGETPSPSGPWTCQTCGAMWDNADPAWEEKAERVMHACFK